MALTQLKTGAIADDAVTTAKLAAGTDGQIITYDASGNPTAVGPGTDGQVLTSTGAGSPPAFETPAPGVGGATGADFNDEVKLRFGTGNDLEIYHHATDGSQILNSTVGLEIKDTGGFMRIRSNELKIQSTTNETYIEADANGAVQLFYDNGKKFETNSSGCQVTGILWADGIDTGDNEALMIGDGDDLQMYHDGTKNLIETHNGEIHINKGTSEYMAKFIPDGAVELYHNNSKKFETYSNGIKSHGNLNFTTDNSSIYMGADDDVNIKHSGSDFLISNGTGGFDIKCTSGTGVGEGHITFSSGNGTGRTVLQSDGHFRPYADAAYYLGTSSYRWLNVYTSDLDLSNEAKGGNDIDGTWGHWTIQEGESDLFLKNNRSGKKYKFNLTEVT